MNVKSFLAALPNFMQAFSAFDPTGGKAREAGMSIKEYQEIIRQAQQLQMQESRVGIANTQANTARTVAGTSAQTLANEDAEAAMRSMSGGMKAGEERSRYRPLAVGAENPLPDRPIQQNVGFDTREDAVAGFKSGEYAHKIFQDTFKNELATDNLRRNEKRLELDKVEAARREKQLGLNERWNASTIARNTAEIRRINYEIENKKAPKMTAGQAASIAERMTTEEFKYAEEEVSPQKRMEAFQSYYDRILGEDHVTPEEVSTGEGPIDMNLGAFEDEKQLEGEESAQAEEEAKNKASFDAKQQEGKLNQQASAINKARVQSLSMQERAADPSIPLPQVLDLGPEAQVRELQSDLKQYEAEIRQNLMHGIPVEQWSPGALAFIDELDRRANSSPGGNGSFGTSGQQ